MNRKILMLIWEQARTAGILCLWGVTMAVLVVGALVINPYPLFTKSDYHFLFHFFLAIFSILLLFRQDAKGNLTVQFERRLARLPISTLTLVGVSLITRCFFFFCPAVVLAVLCRLAGGVDVSYDSILMWIVLYTLIQGAVWSNHYMVYLLLMVSIVISIFPLYSAQEAFEKTLWIAAKPYRGDVSEETIFSLIYTILLVASFGVIYVAMKQRRSRKQRRLLTIFTQRLFPFCSCNKKLPNFQSPFDAVVWYQTHNGIFHRTLLIGILVLLSIPVFITVSVALNWLLGKGRWGYFVYSWEADAVRWFLFLTVITAAGVIGMARDFSRSLWPISFTSFMRYKPISATYLAYAHLLVMTRIVFVFLIVVFLLSLGIYVRVFPEEWEMLWWAVTGGNWPRLIVFFVEPLFWACICTWAALTCTRLFVWGALIILCIDLPFITFNGTYFVLDGNDGYIVIYLFCLLVVIRTLLGCYRVRKQNLLSRPFIYAFLGAHVLLALAVWWPGPLLVSLKVDSFYITFAVITLLLSPFVALPDQIARKRARI